MTFKIRIISNPNISLPMLAISENKRLDVDNPVQRVTDNLSVLVAPELFGKNFVVQQIDKAIAEKRSLIILTNNATAINCVGDRKDNSTLTNDNFEFVVCGKNYTLDDEGFLVGVDGSDWPFGFFDADY